MKEPRAYAKEPRAYAYTCTSAYECKARTQQQNKARPTQHTRYATTARQHRTRARNPKGRGLLRLGTRIKIPCCPCALGNTSTRSGVVKNREPVVAARATPEVAQGEEPLAVPNGQQVARNSLAAAAGGVCASGWEEAGGSEKTSGMRVVEV